MIYAASDLHGRWEKYCALLERLSHEDPDYTLYLLGDSIDRNKGGCRILLDAMNLSWGTTSSAPPSACPGCSWR